MRNNHAKKSTSGQEAFYDSLRDNSDDSSFLGWMERFYRVNELTTSSLSQYTKPTNIMSRLYIEQSIVNDEVIPPLISMLHQSYVGYVFSAVQLNQLVDGTRTVRDILQLISTEEYVDSVELIKSEFGKTNLDKVVTGIEEQSFQLEKGETKLLTGKLIDIDIKVGKDKITMKIRVQLIPRFIPTEVAKGFIDLNFDPPLGRRWKQMRAGEISFISDFIAARDLVARHKKSLSKDKDGVLLGMFETQRNSLSKYLLQLVGITPPRMNVANSVLIITKGTFDKACNDNSVNFELPAMRNKFFGKSFMMCVAVVDPLYHQVEIFYHGIDESGEYTYNLLAKGAGGGGDKFDLKTIMSTFAAGRPPSF